jgi:hypothetical protein
MDGVLIALIHDWDMDRCAAVLKGERRGIQSTQCSDVISKINDGMSGLNKRQPDDSVDCHIGSSGNQNTCCIAFLGEVGQTELKPYRQLRGDIDSPPRWTMPDRTIGF